MCQLRTLHCKTCDTKIRHLVRCPAAQAVSSRRAGAFAECQNTPEWPVVVDLDKADCDTCRRNEEIRKMKKEREKEEKRLRKEVQKKFAKEEKSKMPEGDIGGAGQGENQGSRKGTKGRCGIM